MPIGGFGLGFSGALADYMGQERARQRQSEDQQIDYQMELIKSLAARPDINERPEIMGQAIHDMMQLSQAKGGKGKQSKGMAGMMGQHDLPISQFLSGLVSGARPTVGPTQEPNAELPSESAGSALQRTPDAGPPESFLPSTPSQGEGMLGMPSVPPQPTSGINPPLAMPMHAPAPTGGKAILASPIAMPPQPISGPPEGVRLIEAGRGMQAQAAINPPPPVRMQELPPEKQPYFVSPEERAGRAGNIKRTETSKTHAQDVQDRMQEGQQIGLSGAELRDYAATGRIPTSRPTADIQNFEYAKAQGAIPGQQAPAIGAVPAQAGVPPPPVSLRDYQQQKANDKKPVVKPPTVVAPSTTTPIKNYEYAVKQGFKGTFEQWQKEQANNRNVQPRAAGAGGAGTLTPEAIEMAAQSVAKGGPMPALGMGGGTMRSQILNRAAAIYKGLDLASQQAAYKSNVSSLNKLQPQADALESFANTASKNLSQFLQQAQQVVNTNSPLLNTPIRSISANILGDPKMAAFNSARTVVLPEFARIIQNPNMTGALSDSARREVESIVPANATLAQIISVTKILMQDAANRRSSMQEQLQDIKTRIAAPPGQAPAGASSPEQELMNFLKGK